MAQYGRPSSTITDSDWSPSTGSDLWACVDESSYSDTDYIRATGNQTVELKFSSVTDPVSSTGHILRLRAKATGSGGGEKWTVNLYMGTTNIAACFANTTVTRSTFNDYSYTLTEAQANRISDYSDLRVRIVTSQGTSETIDVSWIELEVPNASATYENSFSLGKSGGISGSEGLVVGVSLSIEKSNGFTEGNLVTLDSPATLAKLLGEILNSDNTSGDSISTNQINTYSSSGGLLFQETLSVGRSSSYSDNGVITADLVSILAKNLGLLQSSNVTSEDTASLSKLLYATFSLWIPTEESITLSRVDTANQINEYLANANLNLTKADVINSQNIVEVSSQITLGQFISISIQGGMTYEDLVNLTSMLILSNSETMVQGELRIRMNQNQYKITINKDSVTLDFIEPNSQIDFDKGETRISFD